METKILLNKLTDQQNLTTKEVSFLLEEIIAGNLSSAQIAAFLVGLRTKGETVEEIVGLIQTMRKHMSKVLTTGKVLDIVGTGGDGVNTFNISTASSFVVAGCGVKVAKHGNRAVSSKCGSADVLEALGVNINLVSKQAGKILEKVGMVFLFAPLYHPAMKNIAPVRKELGIRTVFNFLGPFLNPAGTKIQLLGVPNIEIAKTLAKVASKLKFTHLMIITSLDGMDEVTTTASSKVFEVKGSQIKLSIINPQKYGIKKATKKDLSGGDPKQNARIIQDVLSGGKGPKRDVVVLNSAVALYLSGKAKNISGGIKLAEESIDSQAAKQVLEKLIQETQKYAQ